MIQGFLKSFVKKYRVLKRAEGLLSLFKSLRHSFLIFPLAVVIVSCGQKQSTVTEISKPKDITGSYVALRQGESVLDLKIDLQKEEGVSSLMARVNRLSPFSQPERDFLVERNISPERVIEHFSGEPIVLGQGESSNEVLDRGENAIINMCTQPWIYEENLSITYCMTASLLYSEKSLNGQISLRLNWQDRGEVEDLPLSFHTPRGLPSLSGFEGRWIGTIQSTDEVPWPPEVEVTFVVQEEEDSQYRIEVSPKDLQWGGDVYFLTDDTGDQFLSFAEDSGKAHFSFIYRSEGLSRLVLQGQFLSDSSFVGSLWQHNRRSSVSIGILDYFKQPIFN